MLQVVIGCLIFADHEERHKFHDYQGPQGFALCLIRVLFFLMFAYGFLGTTKEVNERSDELSKVDALNQYNFLLMLGLAAVSYLLAIPAAVIFAEWTLMDFEQ